MSDISKLVRQRNRLLALAAISFLLWQGAWLAQDLVHDQAWGGEPQNSLIDVVMVVGSIGWVVWGALYYVLAVRIQKSNSGPVIEDELFKHRRDQALTIGYKVVVVALGGFMLAGLYADFSAAIAIRAVLILAVFTPLASFVLLDRDDGEVEA
tara:strand:- start:341 stop:799 length:459 start_codon:yes stop_codon:yes gene_type:complete